MTDEHQQDFVITVPAENLLRDSNEVVGVDRACFLPFYTNGDTNKNTWVLGSVVLNDHYLVYDMTAESNLISLGIAKNDPSFVPDKNNGGGGGGGYSTTGGNGGLGGGGGGAVNTTYGGFLVVSIVLALFAQKRCAGLAEKLVMRSNEKLGVLVDSIRGRETIRTVGSQQIFEHEWNELNDSISEYSLSQKDISQNHTK